MFDTQIKPTQPTVEDGDHDRYKHYTPKDQLSWALVEGTPVVALCGKKWVPSRDPSRYPLCPECEQLHAGLPK